MSNIINYTCGSLAFKEDFIKYQLKKADLLAAGHDLCIMEYKTLKPQKRALLHTNLFLKMPSDYYGEITPRSWTFMAGLTIFRGIIDSNFRGEVRIGVVNTTDRNYILPSHCSVAQIIFHKSEKIDLVFMKNILDLDLSERGVSGFGSSGSVGYPAPTSPSDGDDSSHQLKIDEMESFVLVTDEVRKNEQKAESTVSKSDEKEVFHFGPIPKELKDFICEESKTSMEEEEVKHENSSDKKPSIKVQSWKKNCFILGKRPPSPGGGKEMIASEKNRFSPYST